MVWGIWARWRGGAIVATGIARGRVGIWRVLGQVVEGRAAIAERLLSPGQLDGRLCVCGFGCCFLCRRVVDGELRWHTIGIPGRSVAILPVVHTGQCPRICVNASRVICDWVFGRRESLLSSSRRSRPSRHSSWQNGAERARARHPARRSGPLHASTVMRSDDWLTGGSAGERPSRWWAQSDRVSARRLR
jgi:hypothetical protein